MELSNGQMIRRTMTGEQHGNHLVEVKGERRRRERVRERWSVNEMTGDCYSNTAPTSTGTLTPTNKLVSE